MGVIKTVWPDSLADRDTPPASLPHVLLVVDQFPKSLGGGERIVLRLAGLLPDYGYRVSILTFCIHPESDIFAQLPACPVYTLELPRTYGLTAFRAAFELSRFLRQQNVRIMETFFESSDIWAGFVAKLLSKTKLVWSRRDMGILRTTKHRLAYRLMARLPDKVFAVSEQVRQHCIDVDCIDPLRVETIYNGLDLTCSPVGTAGDGPKRSLVTTVGNIRRVKGHDVFVRAAAMLAAQFPDVSFSIAGDVLEPEYFDELATLVRDLKLSDRFRFRGPVSNIRAHLAEAEIFVMPSHSEGFSNAIIEAMAGSLPVVATRVGGNAEAVTDGVNGYIVPPGDPAALAEAIGRLLANPAEATKMGAAGSLLATQKFTTATMMNRIHAAYAKLLIAP